MGVELDDESLVRAQLPIHVGGGSAALAVCLGRVQAGEPIRVLAVDAAIGERKVGPVAHQPGDEIARPAHRLDHGLGSGQRLGRGHVHALDPHPRGQLVPAVEALADEELA